MEFASGDEYNSSTTSDEIQTPIVMISISDSDEDNVINYDDLDIDININQELEAELQSIDTNDKINTKEEYYQKIESIINYIKNEKIDFDKNTKEFSIITSEKDKQDLHLKIQSSVSTIEKLKLDVFASLAEATYKFPGDSKILEYYHKVDIVLHNRIYESEEEYTNPNIHEVADIIEFCYSEFAKVFD